MYPISYLVPIRAATIPNNIIMMYLKGNNYVVQSKALRKMYVSAFILAEIHILIIIKKKKKNTLYGLLNANTPFLNSVRGGGGVGNLL